MLGDIGSGDLIDLSTGRPQIAQIDCDARIIFLLASNCIRNAPVLSGLPTRSVVMCMPPAGIAGWWCGQSYPAHINHWRGWVQMTGGILSRGSPDLRRKGGIQRSKEKKRANGSTNH